LPPPHVANGLLQFFKIGEEAYQAFERDRMEGERTTQFYGKMTKKRLNTFSDVAKKASASISKSVVLQMMIPVDGLAHGLCLSTYPLMTN